MYYRIKELCIKLVIKTAKKCVCIPRSFLVINICNRGKTLCSPCTSKRIHYDPLHTMQLYLETDHLVYFSRAILQMYTVQTSKGQTVSMIRWSIKYGRILY
jgi:hypothetical protein